METVAGMKVVGRCLGMCPETELNWREREGLLHIFEIAQPQTSATIREGNLPQADPNKVVKQYSRSAAGRSDADPRQLRPASVLKDTVAYLFNNIVPQTHPAWSTVYEFVFDRLRAVRQDMVIQGIMGRDAIVLLEQVVRFHLYAAYRLRDALAAEFDPVINKHHLLECLKRLLYLYKVTPGPHIHQEEFEGVYLLDNLADTHALTHCLELPLELRSSSLLRQCYEISVSCRQSNYWRALRGVLKLTCPMALCAVNPGLSILRLNYLQMVSSAFSVRNCRYPLKDLQRQLALSSVSAAADLCSRCGLVDQFDGGFLGKDDDFVCFTKDSPFKRPQDNENPASLLILDVILSRNSISSLLLGNTTTSESSPHMSVESSPDNFSKFTEELPSPVMGKDMFVGNCFRNELFREEDERSRSNVCSQDIDGEMRQMKDIDGEMRQMKDIDREMRQMKDIDGEMRQMMVDHCKVRDDNFSNHNRFRPLGVKDSIPPVVSPGRGRGRGRGRRRK